MKTEKKASKTSKKDNATKKVFVTNSGKRHNIIGEKGKFWLCEGHTFRKASKLGHVEEVEIPVEPEATVDDTPVEEEEETEELDA